MSFFKDYYKGYLRPNTEKSDAFLYELALKRGQKRGWYPEEWTINDYKQHLFGENITLNKSKS